MSRKGESPSAKSLSDLFSRAYGAVVDSCSLILMQKGGYCQTAISSLGLLVTCAVCLETSLRNCTHGRYAKADEELLRIAIERGSALISDDKQILMRARRFNIPHLNSLTTLLCLFGHGIITENDYAVYLEHLRAEARYASWIWQYGERAFCIVRDEILAV